MNEWYNELQLNSKIRLIIEPLIFWMFITFGLTKILQFDIFNYSQIISQYNTEYYIFNLCFFLIAFFILTSRLIFTLITLCCLRNREISNNTRDYSYLLLAKIYIEEYYDNYWKYPIFFLYYLFHIFVLELFFFFFISFFDKCLVNNKSDKLYYYKKFSFRHKSSSSINLDF